VLLFLHWAGFSVWLGAQMTFMVWGMASKQAGLEAWAHTWMTLEKIQMRLVLPGAVAATVSGIALTMRLAGQPVEMGGAVWLMGMQGAGLVAGLLAIFVVTPLAGRMGRLAQQSLEAGARNPNAERVRVRLAWAGTISGNLILVAIAFVTFGK
jgi:hypothetical protein